MRVLNSSILEEAYSINKEVTTLLVSLNSLWQNEKYNHERAITLVKRAQRWFGYILTNDDAEAIAEFNRRGNECISKATTHRTAALECYAEIRTLENRIDTITGNVLYFVTDAEEEEWAKLN